MRKAERKEQVFIKHLMHSSPLAPCLLILSKLSHNLIGQIFLLSSLCLHSCGLLGGKAYHSAFPVTHTSHQSHYKVSSESPQDNALGSHLHWLWHSCCINGAHGCFLTGELRDFNVSQKDVPQDKCSFEMRISITSHILKATQWWVLLITK